MSTLTLMQTLNAFTAYLTKGELEEHSVYHINKRMGFYNKRLGSLEEDFQSIKIDEDKIRPLVQLILNILDVDDAKRGRYGSLTVHEFLIEMAALTASSSKLALQNKKINEFIALIDNKISNREGLLTAVTSAGLILISSAPAFFSMGGLTFVETLLAASLTIPVISLAYTAIIGVYSFYQTYYDKKLTAGQRFRDNFFLMASSALNIAAYSVLIAAATTINPVAGLLFVLGSAAYVVKGIVDIIKIVDDKKVLGPISRDDDLETRQQKIRAFYDLRKAQNSLGIELGAAAAMVAIVAV